MMVITCILLVQILLGQVIGYVRCCLEAKIYKVVPYEAVDCALVGSNTLFAWQVRAINVCSYHTVLLFKFVPRAVNCQGSAREMKKNAAIHLLRTCI